MQKGGKLLFRETEESEGKEKIKQKWDEKGWKKNLKEKHQQTFIVRDSF